MRRAVPLALILLALGVRVAFFHQWTTNPFFEAPVLDARGYLNWATEIVSGNPVWDDFRIHGAGYPCFLAVVLAVTGRDIAAATFANSLLGCAWILLLYVTVRRLFHRPTAEVSAVLAAVYWPFLHFEGHLLATTWFIALSVLALDLTTRLLRASHRRRGMLIALGLVFGWATITRPNGVAPLPFVLALLLLPAAAAPALRTRAGHAALVLAGFAAIVSPVLVHNHRLSGMVALQDHTMFNLYLGNGPGSPGYVGVRLGSDWDRLADLPRRRAGAASPAAKNAWFRDRILETARAEPGAFLRRMGRKLLLFWNAREIRTTLSPYFFDEFAPLQTRLPGFGWIGPFALLGLFLAWRLPRRPWALYAFALPSMALVVVTVVGSRYRVSVVPFLIPFAGWSLVRLGQWAKQGRLREAGMALGGLAAAFAIVHHDFPDLRDTNFGGEYARLASVLQERGDRAGAAAAWMRSLREDPGRVEAYLGYAGLALTVRDYPLVEDLTREGLRRAPRHPVLLMMRARALLMLERPEESLDALRIVLPERPDDADLLLGVARAHSDAGRPDSSIHYFRRAVRAAPNRPDVLNDAAMVLLREAALPTTPGPTADSLRTEARTLQERARTLEESVPRNPPRGPEGSRSP